MTDIKLALISLTRDLEVPPMGLVYLATYLEKYMSDGFEVKVIDINFAKNLIDNIQRIKPDIIGISAMSVQYNEAVTLAAQIRDITRVPILIGGVHISTHPQSLSNNFTLGVVGEGEEIMLDILKVFREHRELLDHHIEHIQGVVFFKKDGSLKCTHGLLDDNFDFTQSSHYNLQNPIFLNKEISLNEFRHIYKEATKRLMKFSKPFKYKLLRMWYDPPGKTYSKIRNKIRGFFDYTKKGV